MKYLFSSNKISELRIPHIIERKFKKKIVVPIDIQDRVTICLTILIFTKFSCFLGILLVVGSIGNKVKK